MEEADFERLVRVLEGSSCEQARVHASATLARGRPRLRAKGSMEKRYVNVVGGVSLGGRANYDKDISSVALELERAGFGRLSSIVPGPLVRGTLGRNLLTHMPLNPASTYDSLHRHFDEAFELANAASPDPELDLRGLAAPLWGHHSARRFADTVARQTMKETGATEQDIDMVFGWQEAFYSRKMQIHYDTSFTRDRRSCVTRLV